jgi:hypothetical protein
MLEGAFSVTCGPFRLLSRILSVFPAAIVVASGGWTSIPRFRVRYHLLSTFPFKSLIRLLLRSHRVWSLEVRCTLPPYRARGFWGTSCARHGAAFTVWRARAADGSYGGDVRASRGGTSQCTVVRMPWEAGWWGRACVALARRAAAAVAARRQSLARRGGSHRLAARRQAVIGSPRGDGHRLAARRRSSARRAETVIGSQRGGGHRLAARRLRSSGSAAAPAPAASRQPGNGFGCPACRLFGAGGGLWVLRDDRNGSSRPS